MTRLGFGWAALLLAAVLPAQAGVGTVAQAQGEVSAQTAGVVRALKVGDSIDQGAQLRTGTGGEALIRFTDDALLALRPNTQVDVTNYSYEPRTAVGASAFRLARGALRFVTGLIAKANRDQVYIHTTVATVGVRGTDFDAVFLDQPEQGRDAGLYNCVNDGQTFLQGTDGRRLDIGKGETGFATSADFVAKGFSQAREWGLIQPPAGLFQSGTFDGTLEELKRELMNRVQGKVSERVPAQVRDLVPGAADLMGSLFGGSKKNEKKSDQCGA